MSFYEKKLEKLEELFGARECKHPRTICLDGRCGGTTENRINPLTSSCCVA